MEESGDHHRNIEIKAKLSNIYEFYDKVEIAKELTGEMQAEIIVQHDVFFKVPNGRLKLRYEVSLIIELMDFQCLNKLINLLQTDKAKLVQYSRDNISGPKLSKFNILEVSDGPLLERMLDESMGILGVLDKTRHLFIYKGRTRIHLDIVKTDEADYYGIEFEVVLKPDEDLELGSEIADELTKAFRLEKEQLLEGSYFEILNEKSA